MVKLDGKKSRTTDHTIHSYCPLLIPTLLVWINVNLLDNLLPQSLSLQAQHQMMMDVASLVRCQWCDAVMV